MTFPLLWFAFPSPLFLFRFILSQSREGVLALLLVPVSQFSCILCVILHLSFLNLHSHLIFNWSFSVPLIFLRTEKILDFLFLESHYCLPPGFSSLTVCIWGTSPLKAWETFCSPDFTCYVKVKCKSWPALDLIHPVASSMPSITWIYTHLSHLPSCRILFQCFLQWFSSSFCHLFLLFTSFLPFFLSVYSLLLQFQTQTQLLSL